MPTLDELPRAWSGDPIRSEVGDNLRRPWCWNRPAYPDGTWEPQRGYHDVMTGGKPRYRWKPRKMSSDCKAWDCPPDETPSPVLTRWDCRGCRHMPARARHHFNGDA